MVLLTMTPSIVDGLRKVEAEQDEGRRATAQSKDASAAASSEPSLEDPAVGKPISHGQIVDLWQKLRPSSNLEQLLQGARVYIPPPPPKPEPSDEYKALMARLRREEAARAYERMVNPPLRYETFDQRFPHAGQSFAEANRVTNKADLGDDEVTYNEVHRQVMLIINFLASILGVAATLWVTARWWGLPARIFLTLGGSIVVAVAEVGVYQGYVWRMGQAKTKQKAVREVKEVVQTWVVGQEEKTGEEPLLLKTKDEDADGGVRKRATAAAKPDT
ncbi:ATPase, vacuolar ER assembly factor, Vma12 [Purpureocillium lilacinum]|nr:ATPase, vacuolar ER assembly factor, Vma12 [Purpureocillium lilacinum]